jgi:hypothetical protein
MSRRRRWPPSTGVVEGHVTPGGDQAATTVRRRVARRWLPIVQRDTRAVELATCVDCRSHWTGPGTRIRAGQHAGRRGHRVAFTRTEAYEIRPKRWPEGRT